MQHALKDNRPDNRRRQQLRAILQKYRNLSANKEELAAHMKKKFGINPKLTTLDINRILYRQFGTRIDRGTVSWSGETIRLSPVVTEQLRQNYLVSRGIHPSSHTAINKNSLPQSIVHSCTT